MVLYLVNRHVQMWVRKKISDVNVVKLEEMKEETWENIMKQLSVLEVAHWQIQLIDNQNLRGKKSNCMADFVIPWAEQCSN